MAIYFTQNTNNVEDIEQMNNVIDKVNKVNTEASSNIGQLTDLNNKAQELSNNINQALPLNSELVRNTESAKVTNANLLAANQEATTKNIELQASLEKTKEFIEGLDGSQNIPQLRLDVTELQNGLKSNQALAYKGSSVVANNTLEGRTEGMRIGGRTLVNLGITKTQFKALNPNTNNETNLDIFGVKCCNMLKPNTKYTIYITASSKIVQGYISGLGMAWININTLATFTTTNEYNSKAVRNVMFKCTDTLTREEINNISIMILEEEHTAIPCYFEGLKSFGETEEEGDKYKISILSKSLNNIKFEQGTFDKTQGTVINVTTRITSNLIEGNFKSLLNNNLDFKEFMTIIFAFDLNKRFISTTSDWSDHLEISNLPINTKYIRIVIKRKNEKIISPSDIANVYFGESDKKDILIKEPLRSKDTVQDVLYEDNGQVKIDRYVGIRKYQEGDEKNKDVITDKINTVYILDKPVTEIVENCVDIDLDTFGEKTYFNILNSLPGTLDFKVPSNIASIVQNTAREVNNIWDVINNLLVPSLIDINKNVAMSTIKNNLK